MPTLVTRPIRRPPNRKRTLFIFLAVLGALLIHALLFLAVIWVVPHWPRGRIRARSHPIELTMLPPTLATPEPSGPADAGKPTPPPYIRTTDDQAADKPPDDPAFISSQDTKAASELAATGNKPLPDTEGKNVPAFDFEPRPYRLGTKAADAATSAPSAEATPQAAVSTPPPTPPPVNKKPPLPGKSRPTHKPTAQVTPDTGDLATLKPDDSPSPEPPIPTPSENAQGRGQQRPAAHPPLGSPAATRAFQSLRPGQHRRAQAPRLPAAEHPLQDERQHQQPGQIGGVGPRHPAGPVPETH